MVAIGMVGLAYAEPTSWTGVYAGVTAGLVFNHSELVSQQLAFTEPSNTCNTDSDLTSFSPGLQVGYLYQFSNLLVTGVEANFLVNTNQRDTLTCDCSSNPNVYDRFPFKNTLQGSIKGRIGRAINSWNKGSFLPYLTVGASFADVGLTYENEGGNYYSKSNGTTGWLIGAGIEWAFRQHWSVRTEYFYVDYANAVNLALANIYDLIDPNGNAQVDLSSNNLTMAISYWF